MQSECVIKGQDSVCDRDQGAQSTTRERERSRACFCFSDYVIVCGVCVCVCAVVGEVVFTILPQPRAQSPDLTSRQASQLFSSSVLWVSCWSL